MMTIMKKDVPVRTMTRKEIYKTTTKGKRYVPITTIRRRMRKSERTSSCRYTTLENLEVMSPSRSEALALAILSGSSV